MKETLLTIIDNMASQYCNQQIPIASRQRYSSDKYWRLRDKKYSEFMQTINHEELPLIPLTEDVKQTVSGFNDDDLISWFWNLESLSLNAWNREYIDNLPIENQKWSKNTVMLNEYYMFIRSLIDKRNLWSKLSNSKDWSKNEQHHYLKPILERATERQNYLLSLGVQEDIDRELLECVKCGSIDIVSNGAKWLCKTCGKQWLKHRKTKPKT